jgi:hypothetical protein
MLIGGVGSLAAVTLGYLAAKAVGVNKKEKPVKQDKISPQLDDTQSLPTQRQQAFAQEEAKSKHSSMIDLIPRPAVMLLGDVGGTNVRLVLRKVYIHEQDRPSEDIKDSVTNSQTVGSFEEAVSFFLKVR